MQVAVGVEQVLLQVIQFQQLVALVVMVLQLLYQAHQLLTLAVAVGVLVVLSARRLGQVELVEVALVELHLLLQRLELLTRVAVAAVEVKPLQETLAAQELS